jgi:hypothetical protein
LYVFQRENAVVAFLLHGTPVSIVIRPFSGGDSLAELAEDVL